MKSFKVIIYEDGPSVNHNMPCSVFWGESEDKYKAVYNMNLGVFSPSWKAQSMGYYLIYTNTWFKRVIYRLIFKD